MTRYSLGLILLFAAATGVSAQAVSARSCPSTPGLTFSISTSDSTGSASGSLATPRLTVDQSRGMDTTFVIDVAERRWTQPTMFASLEAGWAKPPPRPAYVCAGVSVALDDPTLYIRGARGLVRFRASFEPLTRVFAPLF